LLCCVGLNSVCWKFPQRNALIILKTGSQLSFWRDHSARLSMITLPTRLNSTASWVEWQLSWVESRRALWSGLNMLNTKLTHTSTWKPDTNRCIWTQGTFRFKSIHPDELCRIHIHPSQCRAPDTGIGEQMINKAFHRHEMFIIQTTINNLWSLRFIISGLLRPSPKTRAWTTVSRFTQSSTQA